MQSRWRHRRALCILESADKQKKPVKLLFRFLVDADTGASAKALFGDPTMVDPQSGRPVAPLVYLCDGANPGSLFAKYTLGRWELKVCYWFLIKAHTMEDAYYLFSKRLPDYYLPHPQKCASVGPAIFVYDEMGAQYMSRVAPLQEPT
jgi:hypothetical protein